MPRVVCSRMKTMPWTCRIQTGRIKISNRMEKMRRALHGQKIKDWDYSVSVSPVSCHTAVVPDTTVTFFLSLDSQIRFVCCVGLTNHDDFSLLPNADIQLSVSFLRIFSVSFPRCFISLLLEIPWLASDHINSPNWEVSRSGSFLSRICFSFSYYFMPGV